MVGDQPVGVERGAGGNRGRNALAAASPAAFVCRSFSPRAYNHRDKRHAPAIARGGLLLGNKHWHLIHGEQLGPGGAARQERAHALLFRFLHLQWAARAWRLGLVEHFSRRMSAAGHHCGLAGSTGRRQWELPATHLDILQAKVVGVRSVVKALQGALNDLVKGANVG